MEDKEMEELLDKFTRGEMKAEDLDQETAERYLAFMKTRIRSKLDHIRELDKDTARLNKDTARIKEETAKIKADTARLRKENEEMARRIQRALDADTDNDEKIRRILDGEE